MGGKSSKGKGKATNCLDSESGSEQPVDGPIRRDPIRPDRFARLQLAVIFEVDDYHWLGDGTRNRNWDHDADVID